MERQHGESSTPNVSIRIQQDARGLEIGNSSARRSYDSKQDSWSGHLRQKVFGRKMQEDDELAW